MVQSSPRRTSLESKWQFVIHRTQSLLLYPNSSPKPFNLWRLKLLGQAELLNLVQKSKFIKLFYFHHSSLLTQFSSLVTHYLKYPNFLIPTRLATIFNSHHSIISTILWDPHTDPKKTFLSFFFFPSSFVGTSTGSRGRAREIDLRQLNLVINLQRNTTQSTTKEATINTHAILFPSKFFQVQC